MCQVFRTDTGLGLRRAGQGAPLLTRTTGVAEGMMYCLSRWGSWPGKHRLVGFVCGLLLDDRDRLPRFETLHSVLRGPPLRLATPEAVVSDSG